MPPQPARRQPEPGTAAWFGSEAARRLVQESQRQAVPELTRVFGHSGLYLRPSSSIPEPLSGNMLASVLSLYRDRDGFDGALRCRDAEIPVASGSLSLVYALFVLETSSDPAQLLSEMARVLKPEGVLLLHSLNAWSPSRVRWSLRGLRPQRLHRLTDAVREAGLDVVRRRHVGPIWGLSPSTTLDKGSQEPLLARLRAANLLIARRRDSALTPLRRAATGLGFRPGISAG